MAWELNGNSNTNPPTNFLGTSDDKPLVIKTNGTEAIRVRPSGNVGIGTTNPSTKLHVRGPGGGAVVATIEQPAGTNFIDLKSSNGGGNYGSSLRFIDSGAPNASINSTANGQLRFATNGTEQFFIDGGGKVGIRTSIPAGPLHVLGPVSEPPTGLPSAQNGLLLGLQSTAGYKWIQSYGGALALNPKGNNIGIGTASPDAKLHVSSGGDFNSPQVEITQSTPLDFARLRFKSFGTDPDDPSHPRPFPVWDIASGRGVLNLFVERTGNVMTLTSDGKVGIRTEQPDTELHVNGTATVGVLQITGGGDLAEPFSVEENTDVEPGTVMVIDDRHTGRLKISQTAYDRKVAGVVSGAGGLKPGLTLQQRHISKGHTQVALAGRVYCKAEAISNTIEPGDLLTTSDIPGRAMKAVKPQALHGAILGKAMSPLQDGKGLVLVLVNLQ
jgi:hypothetical protein